MTQGTEPASPPRAAPAGWQSALAARLARAFPGLPWQAAWVSLVGTWLLVLYHHQGSPMAAPSWFLEGSTRLTGIAAPMFGRHLWGHLAAVALLLIVPLALARGLAGLRASDLGLSIRGARREMLLVLGLWVLLIPVIALAARTPGFLRTYPRLPEARADASLFVVYQAAYLVKWTAWEFFFRGFLLFGLRRDLGPVAVLLSTVPFTLMHVGKPEAEMASAVVGGLVLCWIALRSHSIWPGVVIHSLVATTMDFFASSWWR